MEVERIMPNAHDSEIAYLGSILIDPQVLSDTADTLTPDAFYRYQNRLVFEAMLHLHDAGDPIDFVTLTKRLSDLGKLDTVGGEPFLIDLINAVPTSVNAGAYAREIANAHQRRKLVALGSSIANLAFDYTISESDMRNRADALFFSLNGNGNGHQTLKTAKEMAEEHMAEVEARDGEWHSGIPTGLVDLDRLLGGIKRKYIIIAGRPSMGKTGLADTIAVNAAKAGSRVGFIDLEMGHEGKFVRFAANIAHMDTKEIEEMMPSADNYHQYLQAAGQVSELPIFVESLGGLTPATLRRKVEYMKKLYGIDLVIVDYLQLMEGDGNQGRERELSAISRAIKGIVQDLAMPAIVLAQLNRNVEHRAVKKPMLSDLSGSGSLEADCDVALLIYRDEYYDPNTERPSIVEINAAKHRGGATGIVDCYWDAKSARFANLQRVDIALPRLNINGRSRAYKDDDDE